MDEVLEKSGFSALATPGRKTIWQLDFWDTQLRRDENYHEKWDYVWRNPVRKGLVAKPEDWPYAGEINILAWHER
ncbi:MAG TPA: hypothetical protein VG077_17685 [Verrucomicrobiae bacterium]|nr:hypothetical protein [Verrucomicrobiae bacterium]